MKKLLTLLIASSFTVGCASTTSTPEPIPNLVMFYQPLSAEAEQAIATAKHINAMQNAKPCADPDHAGYERSRCH